VGGAPETTHSLTLLAGLTSGGDPSRLTFTVERDLVAWPVGRYIVWPGSSRLITESTETTTAPPSETVTRTLRFSILAAPTFLTVTTIVAPAAQPPGRKSRRLRLKE